MTDANKPLNQLNDSATLLANELQRLEWDRKKSLEQRAITVITTSGTLVTLIFALTSVISKGRTFANIVRAERIPLQTSLWRLFEVNRGRVFGRSPSVMLLL